jgi:peptide/nickel transport system permease protein
MRVANVQLALPVILAALLIDGISRGILPTVVHQDFRVFVLTLASARSLWVNFARTTRASVFVECKKDYVQAAIMMGNHLIRVMLRHILPNIMGPLLMIMTVDLVSAILLEATLSFLGIGLPADSPSLGRLIRIGMQFLLSANGGFFGFQPFFWWCRWFRSILLEIFLRDAFNPRLR